MNVKKLKLIKTSKEKMEARAPSHSDDDEQDPEGDFLVAVPQKAPKRFGTGGVVKGIPSGPHKSAGFGGFQRKYGNFKIANENMGKKPKYSQGPKSQKPKKGKTNPFGSRSDDDQLLEDFHFIGQEAMLFGEQQWKGHGKPAPRSFVASAGHMGKPSHQFKGKHRAIQKTKGKKSHITPLLYQQLYGRGGRPDGKTFSKAIKGKKNQEDDEEFEVDLLEFEDVDDNDSEEELNEIKELAGKQNRLHFLGGNQQFVRVPKWKNKRGGFQDMELLDQLAKETGVSIKQQALRGQRTPFHHHFPGKKLHEPSHVNLFRGGMGGQMGRKHKFHQEGLMEEAELLEEFLGLGSGGAFRGRGGKNNQKKPRGRKVPIPSTSSEDEEEDEEAPEKRFGGGGAFRGRGGKNNQKKPRGRKVPIPSTSSEDLEDEEAPEPRFGGKKKHQQGGRKGPRYSPSDLEDGEEGTPEKKYGQKKQYQGSHGGKENYKGGLPFGGKVTFKSEIEDVFHGEGDRRKHQNFAKYMDVEDVEEGLMAKKLFRGVLFRKEFPPFNSFVKWEGKKVFFKTSEASNRALPGSGVIFKLLEEKPRNGQQQGNKPPQGKKEQNSPPLAPSNNNSNNKKATSASNSKQAAKLEKKIEKKKDDAVTRAEEKLMVGDKENDEDVWETESEDESDAEDSEDDEEASNEKADDVEEEDSEEEEPAQVQEEQPAKKEEDEEREVKLYGEVVYIENNFYDGKEVVVKIERFRKGNVHYLYGRPIDKKLPHLQLLNLQDTMKVSNEREFHTKYFLAKVQYWNETSRFPFATIEKEFGGKCGDVETECQALLLNSQIFHDKEFGAECFKYLDQFEKDVDPKTKEWKIPADERAKRTDLTKDEVIFSIDPVTARDLDDALSVSHYKDDIYRIGVHIADVSHFVRENSPVDLEAKIRTTSIYFPHRVIPMLPRLLCENLCSLNPQVERLAFSIWFFMRENGELVREMKPIIFKSIMKSCAKFSYDVVQKVIEQGKFPADEDPNIVRGAPLDRVVKDVLLLNKIGQNRRALRLDNGSLTFNRVKKRFVLDYDAVAAGGSAYPKSYQFEQRKDANFLVEEYMLLANELIGEFMVKNTKKIALLRQHEPPGGKKLDYYNRVLKTLGIKEELQDGKNIKGFLAGLLEQNPNLPPNIKKILEFNSVRLLELAKYFIVKDTAEDTWHHFALNFDVYTHFTSPIRRYPDVLVHRVVYAILQHTTQALNYFKEEEMDHVIETCNDMKKKARMLSDSTEKLFMCIYLRDNAREFGGIISQITYDWVYILLQELDMEMKVQLKSNKQVKDFKKVSQNEFSITCFKEENSTFAVSLKLYDNIRVKVTATDTFPIDYKVLFIEGPAPPVAKPVRVKV